MEIPVSAAKAQLTELLRRAEAGEEVILTRHGHPAGKIVPFRRRLRGEELLRAIEEIQRSAAKKMVPGPDAAHSQDFLYDEFGLPK
ncbi:MAG: type II toxin-antitoxin system Phd/YefM family antitoxin [Devosia sp.]